MASPQRTYHLEGVDRGTYTHVGSSADTCRAANVRTSASRSRGHLNAGVAATRRIDSGQVRMCRTAEVYQERVNVGTRGGGGGFRVGIGAQCRPPRPPTPRHLPPPMPWENATMLMQKHGKPGGETQGKRGKTWKNWVNKGGGVAFSDHHHPKERGRGLEWANLPEQMSTTQNGDDAPSRDNGKNAERGPATPALRCLESRNPVSHSQS